MLDSLPVTGRAAPATAEERENYLHCPKCGQWFDVREVAESALHIDYHLSPPQHGLDA